MVDSDLTLSVSVFIAIILATAFASLGGGIGVGWHLRRRREAAALLAGGTPPFPVIRHIDPVTADGCITAVKLRFGIARVKKETASSYVGAMIRVSQSLPSNDVSFDNNSDFLKHVNAAVRNLNQSNAGCVTREADDNFEFRLRSSFPIGAYHVEITLQRSGQSEIRLREKVSR